MATMDDDLKYEKLLEKYPEAEKVIQRKFWNYVNQIRANTIKGLEDKWCSNIVANTKHLYKKHGALGPALANFGKNKAVIGIGAGPSFNLNKDVLRELMRANALLTLDEQPFILVCSNHQFKPCLKLGIFPHFVILVDAGDAMYDQLCKDIPKEPKPILLASLSTHPRVVSEWDRQGGAILFYLPMGEPEKEAFESVSNEVAAAIQCEQGGNVLNEAWIISAKFMRSKVFMAVGNDLAYERSEDVAARRSSFYADGDYTSNIKNQRDEAKKKLDWMGFKYTRSHLDGSWLCDLKLYHTSYQLMTYKTWLEGQIAIHSENKLHYYNCSEAGILGVMAHSLDRKELPNRNNWYLLDDVLKNYHTRRLADAASQFLEARQCVGIPIPAKGVVRRRDAMGTAGIIGLTA